MNVFNDDQSQFADDGKVKIKVKNDTSVVRCLGKTFANDDDCKKYYLNLLKEKLNDPEFRKMEGFPTGEKTDILDLSDPPYYTICPNPFINELITFNQKNESRSGDNKEPFTEDISEGKNEAIYKAHGYHTKVPYKAIMKYILYYTKPGDVILDGFCGTGMTALASQMCNAADQELKDEINKELSDIGYGTPEWGKRFTVINDISPIATFIAHNYNSPIDSDRFEIEARKILEDINNEFAWMYETYHADGKKGKINYTVWSDVFTCPECSSEIIFYDAAFDKVNLCVKDDFQCPKCKAILKKGNLERVWITENDIYLNRVVKKAKQVPVLINYKINDIGTFNKIPDSRDIERISTIEKTNVQHWFPIIELPEGVNTEQPKISHGVTHIHHLYRRSALIVLSAIFNRLKYVDNPLKHYLIYTFEQAIFGMAKISRYVPTHYSQVNQYLTGTLYIGSLVVDVSPEYILSNKITHLVNVLNKCKNIDKSNVCITTQSTTSLLQINDNSIDYIFTDPPFGGNIMYSELNFLWESWLKVFTNNKQEAIENQVQRKSIVEYENLMETCFKEFNRVLKPGKWMTVEFSNTKASVWNAIQNALEQAGFVVANVSALDKKQKAFKAIVTPTAVKQDLIISCYKPNGGLEHRFNNEASTEEGVWDFTRTHLKYLPVYKGSKDIAEMIPERDPRILFDRMVAYYVRHGFQVPISSQEFQTGLLHRFVERDGMFFLPEQIIEYDKKRTMAREIGQRHLFVCDERSAVEWLRDLLKRKPSKIQDIQPGFMPLLGAGWTKHEKKMELAQLLEENFLRFDGRGEVPSQIHSYLSSNFKELRNLSKDDPFLVEKAQDRWYVPDPNKAGDLEKLRERVLLREFEQIKQSKSKVKEMRIEAVRAGFKEAWSNKDYHTIVNIAKKLPEDVIQSDDKLLMYYENALLRIGE